MPTVPTLKERIGSLLGDSATADVTFVVGEERERFPAHSQVISTASDSLKAMFFAGFNRESVIEVPDVASIAFRVMLRYIYTDEADITEDNIESVAKVSDKYLLTGLFAECVTWVKQNLTTMNVCRFLPLGQLYSDIGEVCWELTLSRGDDVLNSEGFLSLPKDLLAKLLASDELVADEITIYGRAIDWAKRQLLMSGHQDDPVAIRATLGDVLHLIRFPLFSAEEFAKGPSESGILSAEECVSIFQWLNAKKKPALFSVDARALLGLEEVLKLLGGVSRCENCKHERGVKVSVMHLRKLSETARLQCQHSAPWICFTCNDAFCGTNASCGLFHHSQQTEHALYFDTRDCIFCGTCRKYLAN